MRRPFTVFNKEPIGSINHMSVELWRVIADTPEVLNLVVTIKDDTGSCYPHKKVFAATQIDNQTAARLSPTASEIKMKL